MFIAYYMLIAPEERHHGIPAMSTQRYAAVVHRWIGRDQQGKRTIRLERGLSNKCPAQQHVHRLPSARETVRL